MAKLPQQIPIYSALTNKTPVASLSGGDDIEVLWWSPVNYQTQKGRYEVRYTPGFTVELKEGASTYQFPRSLPPGKISVDWLVLSGIGTENVLYAALMKFLWIYLVVTKGYWFWSTATGGSYQLEYHARWFRITRLVCKIYQGKILLWLGRWYCT